MKRETSDFLQWIDRCAAALNESGRYGQSINYVKARRSFAKFIKECSVRRHALRDISPSMINSYNVWLESNGMVRNSVSFYNRQLRSAYNMAVKAGKARDHHPFDNVYTGVDKTRKRAVSFKDMCCICMVSDEETELTRDMFEFSFCTCGMSFADMAYLRKSDICDGVISYSRKKTHTKVIIPVEKSAEIIIKKYSSMNTDSPYLFPILGKLRGREAYIRYRSALSAYNRSLKSVAKKAGTKVQLTGYVARHTWASAAHNTGAPVSVISSALGHSSEKTTRIYLENMDLSRIGAVNMRISKEMRRCRKILGFE